MAVPSSGEIKLNADVNFEINGSIGTDVSLISLSVGAGFSEPYALTEFYGYTSAVAPSVTTNSATSVTTNSMVANGNVTSDGGGTITERGFYFGTNSSSATSNTKYTVSGTTGSFSRTFSGLSQTTTYYYWAYAKNSAGTTIGSRITQATSYPYTFSNTAHYMTAPSPSARLSKYYAEAGGTGNWLYIDQVAPYQTKCINHSTANYTSQQNRMILTGGDGSGGTYGRFRVNYADAGCSTISSTSNRSTSGYGQISVSSTQVVATYWTTYNLYYGVP